MRALAVICLVGCNFEHGALPGDATGVTPDTPIDGTQQDCGTHDFDGDGHFDGCDHCPHLPSATDPDGDGDGVGDDCDPRPTLPGDARVIWLAFYDPSDIVGWKNTNGNGAWSVSGGLLHETNAGFSLLDAPASYQDAYFATSLEVVQPTTNEIGFCLSDIQPSTQYYCCAAYNPGNTPGVRAASQYAGSPGQISAPASFAGNLGVGQHIEMVGTLMGTRFDCKFTQGASGGPTSMANTTVGGKLGPPVFYTTAPVNYRYAFVVTIGS